jgi:heme-degrading monooxygenase HmoA
MPITEVANMTSQRLDGSDATLRDAFEIVRATPGCGGIGILRGIEDPTKLAVVIEWESVEHHLRFRESPRYTEYRQLLGRIEPADVSFEHFGEVLRLP